MASKKLGKFTIKFKNLAPVKHIKILMAFEKQADLAFDLVIQTCFDEIKQTLQQDKLMKSDNKLKGGWTGEVPKIEINITKSVETVIERYLKALRWVLLGDLAGKGAREAAEACGLVKKIVPGLLPSAYLQSLDAQRQHHTEVMEELTPKLPADLIKESIKKIKQRADRIFDPMLANIKSVVLDTVDRVITDKAYTDMLAVHENAMDVIESEGAAEALERAKEVVDQRISKVDLTAELEGAAERLKNTWQRGVRTELAGSSAVGAHQAMLDIFGAKDPKVRVVWVMVEDEKTCEFCRDASKDNSGEFKYYQIGDFHPTGWNYGKKRKDWELQVPPAHPNCRCTIIYVPPGFAVTRAGDLIRI